MATQVDQRVVQMQFDNKQFEAGIQETLQSLNKLNDTIEENTKKTGKEMFSGMESQLSKANSSFDKMNSSLDVMTKKFSALGTISDQVLRNIGNSVSNFFHKGLSMITSGPREGFKEYEDMMGSVQTIMAGTGESLDKVNKKLDELNKYSDDTIYKFQDMTSNIGKFTNQGVKLDDAVAAIKGIANEAAISGANAQQASHAMYNFAQALSSGYTKLIDWKSIENSMMATVEFKNTLLQTAEALGTVKKVSGGYRTVTTNMKGDISELFNAQKGFNDSLQYQWLTNDTLTTALKLYATDIRDLTKVEQENYEKRLKSIGFTKEQIKQFEQLGMKAADAAKDVKTFSMLVDTLGEAIGSGWTQSFRTVIGDFEEAKGLWTGISNILGNAINKVSDFRNSMLAVWKAEGGRKEMLQSIANIFNAIWSVLKPIGEALQEVTGYVQGSVNSAKGLLSITDFIERFTRNLILTKDQMADLKAVAKTTFSIIKTGLEVILAFRKPIMSFLLITTAIKALQSLFMGGLGLNTIISLFKIILSFNLLKTVLGLNKSFKDTGDAVGGVSYVISSLIQKVEPIIKKLSSSKIIQGIVKGLRVAAAVLQTVVGAAIVGISLLIQKIKSIDWNNIKKNLSAIGTVLIQMKDSIVSFITKLTSSNDIFGTIARGLLIAGTAISSFVKSIFSLAKGEISLNDAINNVKASVSSVIGKFSKHSETVGAFGDTIGASADKMGALGKKIEKTTPALQKSQSIFATIVETLKSFALNASNAVKAAGQTDTLVGKFITKINQIDWQQILAFGYILLFIRYLKKLTDSFQIFGDAFDTLGGSLKKTLGAIRGYFLQLTAINGAKTFKNIAIGVGILTAALIALSVVQIDPERFARAATTIALLTITITSCAAALSYLTTVLSRKVNTKGLGAFTLAMTSFAGVLAVLGIELGATTLIINVLYNHIQSFQEFLARIVVPVGILAAGFAALIAVMAAFAKFSDKISKASISMLKMAAGIAALAASIVFMNMAIKIIVVQAGLFMQEMTVIGGLIFTHIKALQALFGEVGGIAAFLGQLAGSIAAVVVIFIGLKAVVDTLNNLTLQIAGSIGLLSLSLIGMSVAISVLSTQLGSPLKALQGLGLACVGILGVLAILSNTMLEPGIENLKIVATSLLALSGAFIIFAAAVTLFGKADPTVIGRGLLIMAGGMAAAALSIKIMNDAKVGKIAGTMLALAGAMYILAPIMAVMGVLWKPMAAGLGIVAGMMLSLAASVKLMDKAKPLNVIPIVGVMLLAIQMMGKMAISLAALPMDQSIAAAAEIAGMMLALGLAIKVAGDVTKDMKGLDIVAFIATISSFSVAIYAMSQIVTALAGLQNVDAAITIAESLSMMMLAMSASIALIANVVQGFKALDIVAFMATVLSFSGAIAILSLSLVQIAQIPAQDLLGVALALNATMIIFAACMSIMMLIGQNMSAIASLGISVMMIAFAGAIAILAASMTMLAQIPTDRLTQVAIVIGVLMGIMVALTAVVGLFGTGLSLATPAILAFAAVILSIAAAFIAFGAGAALFGLGAMLIAKGIAAIITAITGLLPQVTAFVTAMAALSDQAGSLALMAGALTLLGLSLIAIGAGGGIAGAGLLVFAAGLGAVLLVIVSVAEQVAGFLISLKEVSEEAAQWGMDLAQKLADGISAGIDLVKNAASSIASAIASFLHFSTPDEGPLANSDSWMPDFTSMLADGLEDGVPKVKAASSDIASGIADTLNPKDGKELGENFGSATASGVASTSDDAQNAGQEVGTAASEGVTEGADAENTGKSNMLDLVKGVISGEVPASTAMENFGSMAKDKLSGAFDGNGTGGSMISDLMSGIASGDISLAGITGGNIGDLMGSSFLSNILGYVSSARAAMSSLDIGYAGAGTGTQGEISFRTGTKKNNGAKQWSKGKWVMQKDPKTGKMKRVYQKGSWESGAKNDSGLPFSWSDFASKGDSSLGTKPKGTTPDLGGGGGDSGSKKKKGSGGGSGKSAKDNTKALEEFQNTLEKFNERAIPIINKFSTSFGSMMSTISDSTSYQIGAEGFELLLSEIYKTSNKADEVYEDSEEKGTALQQRANAIREAFVEAFDKISKAIQGSLDFYTEFDKKTSSMIKPDRLIMNAKSQVDALRESTDALTSLAYRGVDDDTIANLGEDPLKNYQKIMELRQMSNRELKEFLDYQSKSEKLAQEATVRVESARMVALYLNKLGLEGVKTYDQLNDQEKAYVDALQVEQEVRQKNVDLTKTQYGNVDLNNRFPIFWDDKNLEEFGEALKSWNFDLEELKGNYSTVEGMSSDFDGIEIAFSPMLETDDGAVFLNSDTVHYYIQSIVDAAKEAGGDLSSNILALDAKGMEIDGERIKGLIADIGDTAMKTGEVMHYVGTLGAMNNAYSNLKKYADAAGMSLEDFKDKLSKTVDGTAILKATIISGIKEAYTQFDNAMSKLSEYESKAKAFGSAMKDAIEGFGGAFESLDISSDTTGKQLLSNLEKRISGIKDYQLEILRLRQRGLNQEALQELISQGQGTVIAAGKMGDNWIKQVNDDYKKYKEALKVSAKKQDLFEKYTLLVEKNTNKEYQNEIKNAENAKKKITQLNKEYQNLNLTAAQMDEEATKAADHAVSNIAGSMDDGKDAVKVAAKELGETAVSSFTKSAQDVTRTLGESLSLGESGMFGDTIEGIGEVSNEFLLAALNYQDFVKQVGPDNDTAKQAFDDLAAAAQNYGIAEEQLGAILQDRDAVQGALTDNILKNFDKVFKKATESSRIVEQFTLTANEVGDAIKSVLDNTNLYAELSKEQDAISGDELITRMRGNLDKAEKELQNYLALEAKGLSSGLLEQLAEQGPEYLAAATQWTSDQVSNANAMYERATTIGDDAKAKATQQWLNAGTMNGQTYQQALSAAMSDVNALATTVQTMVTNFSTVIDPALISMGTEAAALFGQSIQAALSNDTETISQTSQTTASAIATNMATGLQTGYQENETAVANASKGIADKATSEIDKKVNSSEGSKNGKDYASSMVKSVEAQEGNMFNAGSNLMQGLINGINSKKEEFDALCNEIAGKLASTVASMNQIHSPSRVMFKLGQFMDEGYIRGLDSSTDRISEVANNISSIVGSALDVDLDENPTITPVIDYSNIYASQGLISSMYNGSYGINLNPNLGDVTTPKDSELNRLNGMFGKISNGDVVSAITSLRKDVVNLGSAVSQMQIVLDSGEIAGAVSNGVSQNINNAVGRRESVWA